MNYLLRMLMISLAPALSACSLITSPLVTGVQLASTAVTSVANMAPNASSNGISHPHEELHDVCIELNAGVIVADFIPELQKQLRAQKIESRIYAPGNVPSDCPAILYYTVLTQWGSPLFSDDLRTYITDINLLLKKNGRVLANASYHLDGMGYDKWSATGRKLAPLLQKMFTSDNMLPPQNSATSRADASHVEQDVGRRALAATRN